MDELHKQLVADLLRTRKVASLATLHNGHPSVSMVLFAPAPDFSTFYLHISRLAGHTRDIEADDRVSLMITGSERDDVDYQQIPRVSITGRAFFLTGGDMDYSSAQALYIERFPASSALFTFDDFRICRISPLSARVVLGFASAFNLRIEDLLLLGKNF